MASPLTRMTNPAVPTQTASRVGSPFLSRRPLLGARGDLVQVRRQRQRGSPTAQLESRLKVEAIVNTRIQPRQAYLLGNDCHSGTLAWEGGGEYATIRDREAG